MSPNTAVWKGASQTENEKKHAFGKCKFTTAVSPGYKEPLHPQMMATGHNWTYTNSGYCQQLNASGSDSERNVPLTEPPTALRGFGLCDYFLI